MNTLDLEQVAEALTQMMEITAGMYNTLPFSEQTFMLFVQDFA